MGPPPERTDLGHLSMLSAGTGGDTAQTCGCNGKLERIARASRLLEYTYFAVIPRSLKSETEDRQLEAR